MSKTVKKICPITKLDEITIVYPDVEELIVTQRKDSNGNYKRVLRPKKEVNGGLSPEVACPSQGHPLIDVPSPLGLQLWKEGKVWCRKTRRVCPMEKILQDLL